MTIFGMIGKIVYPLYTFQDKTYLILMDFLFYSDPGCATKCNKMAA
jgi:hypothetical protein